MFIIRKDTFISHTDLGWSNACLVYTCEQIQLTIAKVGLSPPYYCCGPKLPKSLSATKIHRCPYHYIPTKCIGQKYVLQVLWKFTIKTPNIFRWNLYYKIFLLCFKTEICPVLKKTPHSYSLIVISPGPHLLWASRQGLGSLVHS